MFYSTYVLGELLNNFQGINHCYLFTMSLHLLLALQILNIWANAFLNHSKSTRDNGLLNSYSYLYNKAKSLVHGFDRCLIIDK